MERRTLVDALARGPDAAAVELYQLASDVEAEADTSDGGALGSVHALEALEQAPQPVGWDAQSLVLTHTSTSPPGRSTAETQIGPPPGEYLSAFDTRLRSTRSTCAWSAYTSGRSSAWISSRWPLRPACGRKCSAVRHTSSISEKSRRSA